VRYTAPVEQQSHHCGIETLLGGKTHWSESQQQSHHCGIETKLQKEQRCDLTIGSNRTIVGLKQQHQFRWTSKTFLAAIAPLWD